MLGNFMEINIPIKRITTTLAVITFCLLVIGFGANIYIFQVAEHQDTKIASLLQRVDLGFEPSLSSYFSALLLLVCSLTLWLIHQIEKSIAERREWAWFGLSAIFFCLSIDEAIMIHEMTDGALHSLLNTSGVFYLAWVIPGIVFVVLVGIVFLPFLLRLEKRTQRLFFLSAFLFVGGAIGMEMIASLLYEQGEIESVQHSIVQTIEEGMEMYGTLLFLYALLKHLQFRKPTIGVQLT